MSGLSNHSALSLGNAYGSCIFNIAAILGISALIKPIIAKRMTVLVAGPALFIISALTYYLISDSNCSKLDSIILLGVFNSVNQTTNINYYETSKIDYKVTLTNNDLYTEDQLGEDYGFVSSLIKEIEANINYDVEVDSEETTFDYKYKSVPGSSVVEAVRNDFRKDVNKIFDGDVSIVSEEEMLSVNDFIGGEYPHCYFR
jgi:hypothetical protein